MLWEVERIRMVRREDTIPFYEGYDSELNTLLQLACLVDDWGFDGCFLILDLIHTGEKDRHGLRRF
jgi:hypothetical protein